MALPCTVERGCDHHTHLACLGRNPLAEWIARADRPPERSPRPDARSNTAHRRHVRSNPGGVAVPFGGRGGERAEIRPKGGVSAERGAMSLTAWLAVAVFAAVHVLIAKERVHRVAAVLGGVVPMLLITVTDGGHAFLPEHAGADRDVIFLLLGMMLIVSVLTRTGVFEFVAIRGARQVRRLGEPHRQPDCGLPGRYRRIRHASLSVRARHGSRRQKHDRRARGAPHLVLAVQPIQVDRSAVTVTVAAAHVRLRYFVLV